MPVAEKPRGGKFVDKLGRYNQITQAHARKQHLAEAAGEHHRTASAIQSLKRRNWTPGVTIFAVVVILEDHCSDLRARPRTSSRRSMLIVTPSGNWWEGVMYMSLGRR